MSSILLSLSSSYTELHTVSILTKLLVHGAEGASWKDLYWMKVLSDLHRNVKASKLCSD